MLFLNEMCALKSRLSLSHLQNGTTKLPGSEARDSVDVQKPCEAGQSMADHEQIS